MWCWKRPKQPLARHAATQRPVHPSVQSPPWPGVAHLFQGRYRAIVVEKDSYLLELCFLREIADHVGVHYVTVSRQLKIAEGSNV